MPVVRPYPLGEGVQARPLGGGRGPSSDGGLSSFGQTQPNQVQQTSGLGRDLQVAGSELGQASDSLTNIALREQQQVNEARVQDLNTQFITGQQQLLNTGDNAFYKKQGKDAIEGAPIATQGLLDLQKSILGQTVNGYQKNRLTAILNNHVDSATQDMSRHVAAQSIKYQQDVAIGKSQVTTNQIRIDAADADKVQGYAAAQEDNARAMAKAQGLSGTPAEEVMVAKARSAAYGTQIDELINRGEQRRALAVYDANKSKITDSAVSDKLDTQMRSIRADVNADNYIIQNTPSADRASVRKFFEAKGYSAVAASALAGNFQAESQFAPGAVNPKDGSDGSDSIGIGQWNGSRARDLQKFAVDNKLDPQNTNTQLQFAAWELENTEKAPAEKLKNAKTIEEANQAAIGFFRPKVGGSERLAYSKAALDQGVGFQKVADESLIQKASTDPSLNIQERAAVITKLTKQSAIWENARSAQIKGLDDVLEASTQAMIAAPSVYKKGTLAQIADGYEAAGDRSKAVNTRLLAANEDFLLAYATSPDSAQKRILQGLLPGKAQALASGLLAADEKGRAEAGKQARDEFTGLKDAASANLPIDAMEKKARGAVDLAVKANDGPLAKDIVDFYESHVRGQAIGQAPPVAQQKAIDDLRAKVTAGEQSNAQIQSVQVAQQITQKQTEAFAKDPMAAGSATYKEVGPLAPATDMPTRVAQADKIAANRGLRDISPYTEAEASALRQQVDTQPPDQQAKVFSGIAATVPARMIPKVAMQLAGKGEGDPLSRSYAAALSFYADKDPASRQVADQILQGAKITRDLGEAGKKAPAGDPAWQDTLQTRMGNIFLDMGTKVPAVIADAIASIYTYQMHRQGRQGEKIDTDVLDAAAKSVVGDPVKRNGQAFLPPRGLDTYGVDSALHALRDEDLPNVKTLEGDPVTADVVYRRGILTNAGQEGRYFVRIPDPRATMDPRPIVGADGRPFVLDLKPLVERSKVLPPPNAPDYITNVPSLAPKRP